MSSASILVGHRALAMAVVLVLLIGLPGAGFAARYQYTVVAGGTNSPFRQIESNGVPAINNQGTVVFGADEALYQWNDGVLTFVLDLTGSIVDFEFEEVSINSSGVIAFQATLSSGESGVFTISNGDLTTIALERNDTEIFSGLSINDSGTVAFWSTHVDSASGERVYGVYTGDGGPLTTIAEETQEAEGPDIVIPFNRQQPSINNAGDVAFVGRYDTGEGVYVSSGDGLTRIVDSGDGLFGFYENARTPINDSGEVAFAANSTENNARGVFLYSGDEVSKIVDASILTAGQPGFHDLTDVMINNEGIVAFGGLENGRFSEAPPGVYVGTPDGFQSVTAGLSPVPDLGLPGSRFWGQGFNDHGQVAFYWAGAIYLATPIPEPATLTLLLATAPLVLRRRG